MMEHKDLTRFLAKIRKNDNGCWEWTAAINTYGYAIFWLNGKNVFAHRAIYEHYKGAIENGLITDHLCRNHKCVNPDHLEPVTSKENTLRGMGPAAKNAAKTHCNYGHPYSLENTFRWKNNRMCKQCRREIHLRNFFQLDSRTVMKIACIKDDKDGEIVVLSKADWMIIVERLKNT